MTYSSWDKERDRLKLVILGQFLQFYPPKNKKYQNFAKMKKKVLEISFYKCVPKITIIQCTVPETLSETDRIFCPFTPQQLELSKFWKIQKKHHEISSFYRCLAKFTIIWCMLPEICSALAQKTNILKKIKKALAERYYLFTYLYHKWRSYDEWFLRYKVRQTEFFVILSDFLPFYPPDDPQNQN